MYIAGIDPGKTGGVCLLSWETPEVVSVCLHKMPVGKTGEVSTSRLGKYLPDNTSTVFVENVHAFRAQGVTSMFTFGKGFGAILGLLDYLGHPVVRVEPRTWQKALGIDFSSCTSKKEKKQATKNLAREKLNLPPGVPFSDGPAEAFLIAVYGWLVLTSTPLVSLSEKSSRKKHPEFAPFKDNRSLFCLSDETTYPVFTRKRSGVSST